MTMAKNDLFEDELQELAQLFKALAHPARLQILRFLGNRDTCYSGDISEIIPLGRTTVNQHIAELKKAGLIKGTSYGNKTNYCLNPPIVNKLNQLGVEYCQSLICKNNCNTKEC